MTRFRVTVHATWEYEVDPDDYPGASTNSERIAIDMKNAEDDPHFLINQEGVTFTTTGEIVND